MQNMCLEYIKVDNALCQKNIPSIYKMGFFVLISCCFRFVPSVCESLFAFCLQIDFMFTPCVPFVFNFVCASCF